MEIKNKFETKKTKAEIKILINNFLMPELKKIADKIEWNDDTLIFVSKIGDGFVKLEENIVILYLNFSFFDSFTKEKRENIFGLEKIFEGDFKQSIETIQNIIKKIIN